MVIHAFLFQHFLFTNFGDIKVVNVYGGITVFKMIPVSFKVKIFTIFRIFKKLSLSLPVFLYNNIAIIKINQ